MGFWSNLWDGVSNGFELFGEGIDNVLHGDLGGFVTMGEGLLTTTGNVITLGGANALGEHIDENLDMETDRSGTVQVSVKEDNDLGFFGKIVADKIGEAVEFKGSNFMQQEEAIENGDLLAANGKGLVSLGSDALVAAGTVAMVHGGALVMSGAGAGAGAAGVATAGGTKLAIAGSGVAAWGAEHLNERLREGESYAYDEKKTNEAVDKLMEQLEAKGYTFDEQQAADFKDAAIGYYTHDDSGNYMLSGDEFNLLLEANHVLEPTKEIYTEQYREIYKPYLADGTIDENQYEAFVQLSAMNEVGEVSDEDYDTLITQVANNEFDYSLIGMETNMVEANYVKPYESDLEKENPEKYAEVKEKYSEDYSSFMKTIMDSIPGGKYAVAALIKGADSLLSKISEKDVDYSTMSVNDIAERLSADEDTKDVQNENYGAGYDDTAYMPG